MLPRFKLAFCVKVLVVLLVALGCVVMPSSLAGQQQPVLTWQTPGPVSFPSALGAVQLNAVARAGPVVPVPLDGSYNVTGITSDGFVFAGGFDASGAAYATGTLGPTATWQGVQFRFGPVDQADAVTGATVALPQGSYDTLLMLGALVNNATPAQVPFTVRYTDGTITTQVQIMSDWVNAQSYPGESVVQCAPTRHYFDGSTDANSVCVYGYAIKLDKSKVVASLTLPPTRNVLMLAMALQPPVVDGSFSYDPAAGTIPAVGSDVLLTTFTPIDLVHFSSAAAAVELVVNAPVPLVPSTVVWPNPAPVVAGTALSDAQLDATATFQLAPVIVDLSPYYRTNALYADGERFNEKGVDGAGAAFSATQLGSSLHFAGGMFPLGPIGVPDVASSSPVPLPAGQFASMSVLAAANGVQLAQPFTVDYTDGSSSTASFDMSSWTEAQGYAGEAIAASTTHANTADGGQIQGDFYVYGYTLPLDPGKVVQALVPPVNTNVLLFGVSLQSQVPQPLAGTWVYDPPAGNVPALGATTLHTMFTPQDRADFLPAAGTSVLVVNQPVLTVSATDASRVYGTANPVFTGSVVGARPGDTFAESFTTAAVPGSAAGQYAIVPAVTGAHVADYNVVLQPGTLTISPAGVTVQLTAGAGSVLQGDPVTLRGEVDSTTTEQPGGLLSFYDGASLLGSVPLKAGVATLPQQVFSLAGVHALRAVYPGDENFAGGTGTASLRVLSTDFSLTADGAGTESAHLGESAQFTLHLAPDSTSYPGAVTLSVAGALPPLAVATFTPNVVGAGNGACDVVLTISTRKLAALDVGARGMWACMVLLPSALLLSLGRRRSRVRLLIAFFASVLLLIFPVGCGSGYHNATYPLVVTATSADKMHSVSLLLQIEGTGQ